MQLIMMICNNCNCFATIDATGVTVLFVQIPKKSKPWSSSSQILFLGDCLTQPNYDYGQFVATTATKRSLSSREHARFRCRQGRRRSVKICQTISGQVNVVHVMPQAVFALETVTLDVQPEQNGAMTR